MTQKKKPGRRAAKPKPEQISITEFCARLGISRKAGTAHIERGTVPSDCIGRGQNGRVVLDAARAIAAVEAELARRAEASASLDALPEGLDMEDPETWPQTLDGLRVVREWWVARHAKRKDDLAAGELLRAEDVRRDMFQAARTARDQLLLIPDRVAEDVAAELGVSDVVHLREVMAAGVERVLHDLAQALSTRVAS